MRDGNRHDNSDLPVWRTRRAGCLVILALGSLSLLVAACGGESASPGVASVGSTTTTTASASALPAGDSGTSNAGALAYAQCMRTHGLSDFPDPNAQGGFDDLPSNISFNSPQYVAANKVYQPLNGGGHLSAAKQAELQAGLLKFAQCMRTHGVPNYLDPTFSNGGVSQAIGKDSGVDPNSPTFRAAQKACQSVHDGGGS